MFSNPVIYFIPSIILAIIYIYLIYNFYSGWKDTPETVLPHDYEPTVKISVIVAARNEEEMIGKNLRSILNNNYPADLFQVILVNDHSEDQTGLIARRIDDKRLLVLDQKEGKSGKKQALDFAIRQCTGELIITTDADCSMHKKWIRNIAYAYELYDYNIATSTVVFEEGRNLVENYQVLDMSGMMAVTANGIFKNNYYLANGANLSFLKSSFLAVDGYSGNEKLASGDDMFLIQKMANENYNIGFIKSKESIVTTAPEKNMSDLLVQRKRWATKSKAYNDSGLKWILVLIFLFQLSILANIFLSFLIDGTLIFIALLQLFIKMVMDYMFLYSMATYFDRNESMKSFFGASFISIFIVLYSGFVSLIPGTYQWKGRKVK